MRVARDAALSRVRELEAELAARSKDQDYGLAEIRRLEARVKELEAYTEQMDTIADEATALRENLISKLAAAEADCVSLREVLRKAHDAMATWFSSEYADHEIAHQASAALQSPHPGQAILDRLARAEAVVPLTRSFLRELADADEGQPAGSVECPSEEPLLTALAAYEGTTRGDTSKEER